MNSKWRKRAVILVILIGVGVILRYTVFAPKPVPVDVYRVEAGKVEETVTNSKAGTVKAYRRAQLSPAIGGRVTFLKAREGERVKEGDLLLRLEDTEYRASLELAQRAAQAAQAAHREACTAADLAERELERNRKLSEEGIVSESVLDRYRNQSEAATERCAASKAEASRAAAAVEVARANLDKTELHAPFGGIIVERTTELGEWITPSPPGVPIPPVIDLVDNSSIYIEAPIDETDSSRLTVGLPARISLDPFPDRTFAGTVTRIADFVRDVQGENRTIDVEAEMEDAEFARKLLPGTSADIEVILQVRDAVLRIPTYALLEGNRVLMVNENHLISRDVKTGLRNWEYVEITEGLQKGDQIAVSLDRADVKEGVRVKITEEAGR